MSFWRTRELTGAVLSLAALLAFSVPKAASAGVTNSRHDFSDKVDGTEYTWNLCTPCHRPHAGQGARLWPRSLSQEADYFLQTPGSPPKLGDPDYIPANSLLCYDCHDDNATTNAVDNSPDKAVWSGGTPPHTPQDIAFTDGPPSKLGVRTGYYELYDATVPAVGNPPNLNNPPPPAPVAPTGGHYWRREPTGTVVDFKRGDKLHCTMCHNPHNSGTGTNDAFFRTSTPDGNGVTRNLNAYGTDLRASPDYRWWTSGTAGTGRQMCASCHAYADQGTPVNLWQLDLPRPPAFIPQHAQGSSTPCTRCHKHNKIWIQCNGCHAYPPLDAAVGGQYFDPVARPTTESYDGGAGAHRRHLDALGTTLFKCEICHGPDPGAASWHPQYNQGPVTVSRGNVDIIGQRAYWDPGNTRTTGYVGGSSSETLPPAEAANYDFLAKGGDDPDDPGDGGRCFGLACHGDPPNPVAPAQYLNWTDRMVDDATGNFVGADGALICKWCHDATPATIDGGTIKAPNVMGNGLVNASGFGAEVNGHGLVNTSRYDQATVGDGLGRNGAGKECTLCHDAAWEANTPTPPYFKPKKTHYDTAYGSTEKRLRDSINSQPVTGPDDACTACHQNTGTDAGTQVSQHGNAGPYVPLEPAFTRVCRQCHEVHGANWNGSRRNIYMVGKWLDLNHDGTAQAGEESRVDSNAADSATSITSADNAVRFVARAGGDSFDSNDGTPTNNICLTCHPARTGGGDHSGTGGSVSDQRGTDCTQCHDHDFDDVPTTANAFMPSGCEGCHGKDGNVHRGRDGTQNTADDAPNVMTVQVGASWVSVWDGAWWDTQQGGDDATQQGGHGDPDGRAAVDCTRCHNIGLPSGTHLNGTYESLGTEYAMPANPSTPRPKGNVRNTNTAHLNSSYFTQFPPPSSGNWDVQVYVDNYCYRACHQAATIDDMRHSTRANLEVQFGRKGTYSDGLSIPWPIDYDLSTTAQSGQPDYAPCVSCHDPHGATSTDHHGSAAVNSNHMVRGNFILGSASAFCVTCHR